MAGILARTQSIPKPDRRKGINAALLFLQAADSGSVLVSRNSRDLDLLLQLKPPGRRAALRQELKQTGLITN